MSSANRYNFTYLPMYMPFVFFSSLNASARTSSIVLIRIGENRHPCLLPDFKEIASNHLFLSIM